MIAKNRPVLTGAVPLSQKHSTFARQIGLSTTNVPWKMMDLRSRSEILQQLPDPIDCAPDPSLYMRPPKVS